MCEMGVKVFGKSGAGARYGLAICLLLIAMFSFSSCALCPPVSDPKPKSTARKAEAEVPLQYPTLELEKSRVKSLQVTGEKIAQGLVGFEVGRKLCSDFSKQSHLDELSRLVEVAIKPIIPLYVSTSELARSNHPGLTELIEAARMAYREVRRTELEEGLLWLITLAVAKELCSSPGEMDEEAAVKWSAALLHIATSQELILQVTYAAFQHRPRKVRTSDKRFFWSTQTEALGSVQEVLSGLLQLEARFQPPSVANRSEGSGDAGVPLVGAKAELSTRAPDLTCDTEIRVVNSASPALLEQGSVLVSDTVSTFSIRCRNTSKNKWLISESLVVPDSHDACIYDLSSFEQWRGDIVFPELAPGQSGELVVGPILVSEKCKDEVSLGYKITSSANQRGDRIELQIPIASHALQVDALPLDEDDPGHSKSDGKAGVGPKDKAELKLRTVGAPDFELRLAEFKHLDARLLGQLRLPGVLIPKLGQKRVTADDFDLTGAPDRLWEGAGHTVPQSDLDHHWMLTRFEARYACQSLARFMPNGFQSLYGYACDKIPHKKFVELASRLQQMQCQAEFPTLSSNPLSFLPPAPEGAPTALRLGRIIDPNYQDVAAAIDYLVQLGALKTGALDKALRHLDELVGTPVYRSPSLIAKSDGAVRERSRRLLLAAVIAQAQKENLGDSSIDIDNVLKAGSEDTLAGLHQTLSKIEFRGELREIFWPDGEEPTFPIKRKVSKKKNRKSRKKKTKERDEDNVVPVVGSDNSEKFVVVRVGLVSRFFDALKYAGCQDQLAFPNDIKETKLVYRRMIPAPLESR